MKIAIIFLVVTLLAGCSDSIGPFIKYQEVEGVKVPHFFYRTKEQALTLFYDYRSVAVPCTEAKTEKEKFMCGVKI